MQFTILLAWRSRLGLAFFAPLLLAAGCDQAPGAGGGEVESAGHAITMQPQSQLVPAQVPLPGTSIPKYVEALPTFVGARINATETVSIQMLEFQQKVLPTGFYSRLPAPYSAGTYVWGYKVNNSGPNWPAFTLEARRNIATTVHYINNLRNPDGSPLVLQKYVTVDQTLKFADPLGTAAQNGCDNGPPLNPACLLPYTGPVPAVVHLHGGEVWSGYDGGPLAWFTPGLAQKGPAFLNSTYNYNNMQEAATIWYHDHALGMTRTNVYSGLAGFYLIRDSRDTGYSNNPIGLPAGKYEIEFGIQDRMFDTNGQLLFPDGSPPENPTGLNGPPPNPDEHPYWIPEFFGDVMVVNGKTWPYLRVEPRRYRFRTLNGCNARFLVMQLVEQGTQAPGPAVWQIGTDGGLLNAPVKLSDPANPNGLKYALAPGERADIIIDFAGKLGKTFTLTNTAAAPFPTGDIPDPRTNGQIMQFRVDLPLSGADTSYNPAAPSTGLRTQPVVRLDPAVTRRKPDQKRQLTLVEVVTDNGPLEVLVNNTTFTGIREGSNPPTPVPDSTTNAYVSGTEAPRVGSTEVWEIVNLTADAHPMHLHLAQFQILNRQAFNADTYITDWSAAFPGGTYGGVTYPPGTFIPGFGPPLRYLTPNAAGALGGNPDVTPYLQGPVLSPDANEQGWKDTIKANPGEVTRIVVRWAPQSTPVSGVRAGTNLFPFDPSGGPGYVWHCHIIDHEDNEMMRPLLIAK